MAGAVAVFPELSLPVSGAITAGVVVLFLACSPAASRRFCSWPVLSLSFPSSHFQSPELSLQALSYCSWLALPLPRGGSAHGRCCRCLSRALTSSLRSYHCRRCRIVLGLLSRCLEAVLLMAGAVAVFPELSLPVSGAITAG